MPNHQKQLNPIRIKNRKYLSSNSFDNSHRSQIRSSFLVKQLSQTNHSSFKSKNIYTVRIPSVQFTLLVEEFAWDNGNPSFPLNRPVYFFGKYFFHIRKIMLIFFVINFY